MFLSPLLLFYAIIVAGMNIPAGIALLLATMSSASISIVLRLFRASDNNRYAMILGNYLTCTLVGFLLISDKSLLYSAHPVTYICGIAGGFLYVLSLVCMQKSVMQSGAILSSAFSKLGLLVPLLMSILFFHEQPSFLQGAGLLLVLTSIYLISKDDTSARKEDIHLWFLLVVLFTNGLSDCMAKIYSVNGIRDEESVYVFFIFFWASIFTFCLLLWERKRTGKSASLSDLAGGILIGIPNYFSSILLLSSLRSIPAFIAYPVFSTGAIVFVTVISIPLFKEYLNKYQISALCLILGALVVLNI